MLLYKPVWFKQKYIQINHQFKILGCKQINQVHRHNRYADIPIVIISPKTPKNLKRPHLCNNIFQFNIQMKVFSLDVI